MDFLLNPRSMQFDFTVPKMAKSEGVQKAGGFSRGWHHHNSVRLGIRKENDYYTLYLYAYVKGERIEKRISNVFESVELHVNLKFENRCVSAEVTYPNGNVFSKWHYFKSDYSLPIGYVLESYAEEDFTNKEIEFNVELKNVVIRWNP